MKYHGREFRFTTEPRHLGRALPDRPEPEPKPAKPKRARRTRKKGTR